MVVVSTKLGALTLLNLDRELPIFSNCLLRHGASIMDVDELQTIADTKDGHTKLEDSWIVAGSIFIIDTVWTSGYYDSTAIMTGVGVGKGNTLFTTHVRVLHQ